jgi:molybdopterin-binding protein
VINAWLDGTRAPRVITSYISIASLKFLELGDGKDAWYLSGTLLDLVSFSAS